MGTKKFLILVLLVLSVTTVFADDNSTKAQELNARYNYNSCRVSLVSSEATIIADYGNVSTDKIASDLALMKQYADAGDAASFNSEAKILNTDFAAVNAGLKSAREVFAKINGTSVNKTTIRDEWKNAIAAFSSCNADARRSVVSIREETLQKAINKWNNIIANISSRGYDTTQMQAAVSDAQTLLSSLNDASLASNDTDFKEKVNSANDMYLHIWARFAIARIRSYNEKSAPIAQAANLSDSTAQINSALDSASALASPGKKYGDGEFQATWQDIKDAETKLKDLSGSLREFAKTMRAQRLARGNFTGRGNMTGRFSRNFSGQRFPRMNPAGTPPTGAPQDATGGSTQ